MRSRPFAFLAIFILLLESVLLAQSSKPRIAIKTFENPANYSNSTIGNALTEILTTELGKTGKFRIVERDAANELMKEMNLGQSDWAKSKTFAQKGQLKGAEYFLLGKVTNFGYKEHAFQGQVSDYRGAHFVTLYNQIADVRVDFRVISTESGEAVLTEAGNARKVNRSAISELAAWNQFVGGAAVTSEFSSSLIGRCTVEAIRDVVRKLSDLSSELHSYSSAASIENQMEVLGRSEGKVIGAVSADQYIIGLGSANGILKGDHLKVSSEVLTKNTKGEVIYREPKEIAILEVMDVAMADRAKARLFSSASSLSPKEGDTVQVDVAFARTLRGAATTAAPSTSAGSTHATPGANAQVEELLRKGDRLLEQSYYAQALEQYEGAARLNPSDPKIIARIVSAQLNLKDFSAAEDSSVRLFSVGGTLSVPVAHTHAMNFCTGELSLQNGRLAFRPDKGDHAFALTAAELVSLRPSDNTRIRAPLLTLLWKDKEGKEKKYNLLLTQYIHSRRVALGGWDDAFPATDENIQDTDRLNKMFMHLVQQAVK